MIRETEWRGGNEAVRDTGGYRDGDVTVLLQRWQAGDRDREGELWAILYSELAGLASRMLRRGGRSSLEPEELLNETCLHLLRRPDLSWPSHGHFYAYASRVMHSILTDHGRRSRAAKRRVEIDGTPPESVADPRAHRAFGSLDIDQALSRLARISPRASSLIELRFWEGLPVGEAATVLHISKATAVREWQAARSWLHDQLVPEFHHSGEHVCPASALAIKQASERNGSPGCAERSTS